MSKIRPVQQELYRTQLNGPSSDVSMSWQNTDFQQLGSWQQISVAK